MFYVVAVSSDVVFIAHASRTPIQYTCMCVVSVIALKITRACADWPDNLYINANVMFWRLAVFRRHDNNWVPCIVYVATRNVYANDDIIVLHYNSRVCR